MLPARLDMMGVGPDDVDYVVLSHLHCDHAGCVEYFRKSKIIVHEDEFAGAFRQYALQDHGSPYAFKDLEAMIKAQLHWREIARDEPDQNIVEGVRLLNFGPGHARGMLGLSVSLRSQAGRHPVSRTPATLPRIMGRRPSSRASATIRSASCARCGASRRSRPRPARQSGSATTSSSSPPSARRRRAKGITSRGRPRGSAPTRGSPIPRSSAPRS